MVDTTLYGEGIYLKLSKKNVGCAASCLQNIRINYAFTVYLQAANFFS